MVSIRVSCLFGRSKARIFRETKAPLLHLRLGVVRKRTETGGEDLVLIDSLTCREFVVEAEFAVAVVAGVGPVDGVGWGFFSLFLVVFSFVSSRFWFVRDGS